MTEIVNTPIAGGEIRTKRRMPRIEEMMSTFKLFLKNRIALVGFIITLCYAAIAILDWVYPRYLGVSNISSMIVFLNGQQPSSATPTGPTFSHGWWYYLGTTTSLIPLFPSILAALKVDLTYTVAIVLIGALIGVVLGTMSGYFVGLYDDVLMRVTDIFFSIPQIILAIAIFFALGFNVRTVVISLIIVWWPTYARLTRGVGLTIKSQKFIEAATASGSGGFRNVFRHVLPNVLSPVFVQISLDLGSVILIFATLIFLGFNFGNSAYWPELGNLIYMGEGWLATGQWWAIFVPGIFLLIFTISVNLMGDGLRDVLDPKLRR